ncbi:flagellar hook-associated protein FlgK [Liquorilactobacillus mali]|uniref:Flagellar hook-associated protein 1 n=1 Tax=Liquorilactobacillus mali TaxID=1618 RepID=A0A0R2FZL9_9LACO|nr:flagellar hook-associated protein FlgK [Liquorilactobacillus mali]KRN30716.1 flagellar hook associated protein [Liquorilactobacillus mali]MDN7145722.1 flagellar hook-associated protein FlgK [Liquorilactobacillus mali]
MAGLFGTLNNATSGLSANQVALQTSSNNIANTSTDGYSRQRVNLETNSAYTVSGVGTLGTGVKSAGVERIVDDFVRGQIRNANSNYQFAAEKSDVLGDLENIFNEPSDNGLLTQLSTLTSSWTELSNNPESDTAKTLVAENASTFTDTLNSMADDINSLTNSTVQSVSKNVLDFNNKVEQLQNLNDQIYNMSSRGESPNDLLDTRDSVLKDLSGLADITTTTDNYGRAFVQLDGQDILTSTSMSTLSVVTTSNSSGSTLAVGGDTSEVGTTDTQYSLGTVVLSSSADSTDYQKIDISSGTIGGLQAAIGETQDRLQDLNDFAETIAKTTNMIYTGGSSSTTGFFDLGADEGSYAANITLNSDISNNSTGISAGKSTASGDGTKAAAIAALANTKLDYPVSDTELATYDSDSMSFTSSQTGSTFANEFNNTVTKNGISKQAADNTATAQQSVLTQLEEKDSSVSGVSLNEEMSNIIKYQQGFQANARLLSVVSEMLDTLINNTGV